MHSQQMFNECIARTGRRWGRPRQKSPRGEMPGSVHHRATVHILYRSGCSKTDLPAANAEKEAEHIALLLLLKLLEVFKGTHSDSVGGKRLARIRARNSEAAKKLKIGGFSIAAAQLRYRP